MMKAFAQFTGWCLVAATVSLCCHWIVTNTFGHTNFPGGAVVGGTMRALGLYLKKRSNP